MSHIGSFQLIASMLPDLNTKKKKRQEAPLLEFVTLTGNFPWCPFGQELLSSWHFSQLPPQGSAVASIAH